MDLASDVMTAGEAAKLLRVHVRTIYRLCHRGEIRCFRVGKSWRFRRSVVLTEHHSGRPVLTDLRRKAR